MASSATCGVCRAGGDVHRKVNDSSAAASSRSSLCSSTVAPDRPAAEPRLEVRSASSTWSAEKMDLLGTSVLQGRTSGAGARSGCAGRRAGSVRASSVAALPGAKAAAATSVLAGAVRAGFWHGMRQLDRCPHYSDRGVFVRAQPRRGHATHATRRSGLGGTTGSGA